MDYVPTSAAEPAHRATRSEKPAERLQRVQAEARISFKQAVGGTTVHRLYQQGSAKIRLPHVSRGEPAQAVLINTAGGLTGGDVLASGIGIDAGCRVAVTSQACEKIYRSDAGETVVTARLSVGEGARLDWLPQETILFDGGRLSRRLDADLGATATLFAVEATIFGRPAHNETVRSGLFHDRWRVRRGGRLLFADDVRLDWEDAGLLDRPAVLGGAGAMATLLLVSGDAARHLETLRRIIGANGGASAWNGMLVARITAEGGAALRQVLLPGLVELLDGAALPRLWLM